MVGSVCWVSPESVGPAEVNPALTSAPIGRAEIQLRYEYFLTLKIRIIIAYLYTFKFL